MHLFRNTRNSDRWFQGTKRKTAASLAVC